jgi:transposase
MTNHREILRLYSQGLSQRKIAESCGCGKSTVQRAIALVQDHGLTFPLAPEYTNEKLRQLIYNSYTKDENAKAYKEPDYEYIHKEMARSGVTLTLLWNEYCALCRHNNEISYMYSTFCILYRTYAMRTKATMNIAHKPGEQMEVDWAGQTMKVVDNVTGEIYPAYIFVSVLSYSGYAYAEAFLTRDQRNWISAHVNAYRHYGGATRILVSDNLKTGVTKRTKSEIILNAVYQEMAEHYGTAVLPTRVRKPKDKPSVEGAVRHISTWIAAALRDWKFFSLSELNEAIWEKLDELNQKPFQKRDGSRASVFDEEESPMLLPLPEKPFEMSEWKICTVAYNYHVSADKMLYSVPYEYVRKQVDVRLTSRTVEIFLSGERIATHIRKYGSPSQYSTLPEHMSPSHREYNQWNAERFRSWARSIGKNTLVVVNAIFESRKIEQQGYRTCMALLKLTDRYSPSRLESACSRALSYTSSPNFKMVQTILATGQDELPMEEPRASTSDFGFIRGSEYYGSSNRIGLVDFKSSEFGICSPKHPGGDE